jgi:hypothetical protein
MTFDQQVAKQTFELALGRILRIANRPFQDGDFEEYERCRAICMDAAEELKESR